MLKLIRYLYAGILLLSAVNGIIFSFFAEKITPAISKFRDFLVVTFSTINPSVGKGIELIFGNVSTPSVNTLDVVAKMMVGAFLLIKPSVGYFLGTIYFIYLLSVAPIPHNSMEALSILIYTISSIYMLGGALYSFFRWIGERLEERKNIVKS